MEGTYRVHPAEAELRESPPRSLPPNCPARVDAAEILRSTNKSGISGVRHKPSQGVGRGWWIASTYLGKDKGVLVKYFSIQKHGDEQAKVLAIAERRKQLQQKKRRPAGRAATGAT